MMKNVKTLLIALCVAFTVFISCDRGQQSLEHVIVPEVEMPEADPIADILANYTSWQYAQPLPAPPAEFTDPNDSGSAHGLGTRTVYLNGLSHDFFLAVPAAVAAGEPIEFPIGLAIVKEIMDDTNTFVWRQAVMLKTDDPMYTDHNGWFYVQYQRDSATDPFVATAGDGTERGSMGCHGCHAKAAHDSVFVTDILLPLGTARLEAETMAE